MSDEASVRAVSEGPAGAAILEVCAIDRERLRQSIYRRVFGEAEPVRFGRFTVLERIGRGGMGIVYKAYDTRLDRKIAVKVIRMDHAVARRALVKEAQALARLSHPHVVHVYEVGEGRDGELFIAMEFVEGRTLRQWVGAERRDWRDVVDVCLQAGEGLAAAHAAGLVHRDFKPDNVIVGDVARRARVRVLDFGLAHMDAVELDLGIDEELRTEARALQCTTLRSRGIVGTPAYMAPEQIAQGEVGPASDQFAFCVTMFEALYGVRPFAGASLVQVHAAIERGAVLVPSQRRGVPKRLHRALVQGLAAAPAKRHASMQLLLDEIQSARRSQRLRRWGALGLAAATVPIAAATIATRLAASPPEPMAADLDEVVMLRAESQLDTDPSAAVELLAELPASSEHWSGRARVVAEQAAAWGLASEDIVLGDAFVAVALAGDRVIAHDARAHTLVAIRRGTGEVTTLIDGIELPPPPAGITSSDRASVYVGPDARWLVVAHRGTARAIELATGHLVDLPATERVVVFSGDGRRIALQQDDRVLVVELATGATKLELPDTPPTRLELALDLHGERVACDVDGLGVYDVATGARRLHEPEVLVEQLAFAGDALLWSGAGGGLHVLSADRRRTLGPSDLRHHELAVLDEGRVVASWTDENVLLIELASETTIALGRGQDLRASADGRRVAWMLSDGQARVHDVVSRSQHVLAANGRITMLAFGAGEDVVAMIGDRAVRTWALPVEPAALRGHTRAVEAIAFAPGGALWSTSSDGTLRRWDLARGEADLVVAVERGITALAISPDDRHLATRTGGGTIELRSTDDATLLVRTEPGHHGIAFADDGLYVADDRSIRRIDPSTGADVEIVHEAPHCRNIALAPDYTRLVGACGDEPFEARLHAWDLPEAARVHENVRASLAAVVLLGRDRVVGGMYSQPLVSIDLRDGNTRPLVGSPRSAMFDAAADGRTVLAATMDGELQLHDVEISGRVLLPFGGERAPNRVAIAADRSLVAYAIEPYTIALRRLPVPSDPQGLRSWVLEHRIVHREVR